jgi:UDP-MurNAc hydroxylase
MMMHGGGKTILMDPWLTDPTYHGSWWHYPPLEIAIDDLPKIDYLYVSHEHPDHFDPPTLQRLDKNVEVIIANFERKRFRDRLRSLGFENITELDFHRDYTPAGSELAFRMISPDRAWDDSAILVRDGRHVFLNVNDCHLDEKTLAQLGEDYAIDLAFLTFTGASQYPNCFDFPPESRRQRALASKRSHLEEFVNWAKLLRTKRAVPAAGNFAFLAKDQLAMNDPDYANSPGEAVDALAASAPEIEGLQMNPGDRWSEETGLQRLKPAPDWKRRIENIEIMSRELQDRVEAYFASEEPAKPGLFERFRTHFNKHIENDRERAAEIGITVWWQVEGPEGGDWYIDFTRDDDWVRLGVPSDWNLRIAMPETLVELGVSGEAIWDNLILSFRSRLARRPDVYMQSFWTWFCKL